MILFVQPWETPAELDAVLHPPASPSQHSLYHSVEPLRMCIHCLPLLETMSYRRAVSPWGMANAQDCAPLVLQKLLFSDKWMLTSVPRAQEPGSASSWDVSCRESRPAHESSHLGSFLT